MTATFITQLGIIDEYDAPQADMIVVIMATPIDKAAFLNRLRSLGCIDGCLLPELTEEQKMQFVRDPVRYFKQCGREHGDAIWREIERRQPAAREEREGHIALLQEAIGQLIDASFETKDGKIGAAKGNAEMIAAKMEQLLKVHTAIDDCVDRYRARIRSEALAEAIEAQPSTAENPNESSYQRGRFDGVMEYGRAIVALKSGKEPANG